MRYCKHQKMYHFDGLKHIKYIKITKFIMLSPIPKKAYWLSLETAGAAIH